LILQEFVRTLYFMRKNIEKKSAGRPPKGDKPMGGRLEIRLVEGEKAQYERAAELSGVPLSEWIRARLNEAAQSALKSAKGSR
jgi:predicted HicB family RNase H-like nuclease